jgi:hypothetical protein
VGIRGLRRVHVGYAACTWVTMRALGYDACTWVTMRALGYDARTWLRAMDVTRLTDVLVTCNERNPLTYPTFFGHTLPGASMGWQ